MNLDELIDQAEAEYHENMDRIAAPMQNADQKQTAAFLAMATANYLQYLQMVKLERVLARAGGSLPGSARGH